ncbi:response regulator transcription factor [Longirhabdus pacifica]|uniref:response regulator transcription factor n=1 Tax=Longirhabdus pacifica TaxID=2305227 RepID=UPI001009096C|nr:response regulator transcription factor [Longirhabdus pacifica]
MAHTILAVDDDIEILTLLEHSLSFEHFHVMTATTGIEAMEVIKSNPIDFVILDIMMPEMDGLELCRKIREEYHMPVMLLSAKDRDVDKIVGLELGADDYMTKPFSIQELVARIKAHFRKLKRMQQHVSPVTNLDSCIVINDQTYEVFSDGKKLDLSTKEFLILQFLSSRPNQVFTREQIYQGIWGDDFGDLNTVTVHIKNIRKKIGKTCDCIKTIWGVGYKFVETGLRS